LKQDPHWRLKEELVFQAIERDLQQEFRKMMTLQKIGLQGYPPTEFIHEAYDFSRVEATNELARYGKAIIPWLDWPTEDEMADNSKGRLASESEGLIAAWRAYFEPAMPVVKP
jgi:hypothetical protein